MSDKHKNLILAVLLGVISIFFIYNYPTADNVTTTQDIMDSIKEVPEAQDKGLILEENLIIVGDLVK